jgi:hypothetical protein
MKHSHNKNKNNNKKTRIWIVLVGGLFVCCGLYVLLSPFSPYRNIDEQKPANPPSVQPSPNDSKKYFSKIEITTVVVESGLIKISGLTDLPENSILSVSFDISNHEPDSDSGISARATVKSGEFSVLLSPPKTPKFKKGPYLVDVLFSPRNQPESVLLDTGKNGEFLNGDQSKNSLAFMCWKQKKRQI